GPALGRGELLGVDFLPSGVRRGEDEVALLSVGRRADRYLARLAVEQVHHDSLRLRKMLVRLGLDHEPNRPFPAFGRGLVDRRLVDLVFELFGPLVRESRHRHVSPSSAIRLRSRAVTFVSAYDSATEPEPPRHPARISQ